LHFGIDHHEALFEIDHGLHEIPKSGSGHLSKIRERDRRQWSDSAHGAATCHNR